MNNEPFSSVDLTGYSHYSVEVDYFLNPEDKTPGSLHADALETYADGNFLYVASNHLGMQIWDISNPEVPEYLSNYITEDAVKDIKVYEDYAYLWTTDGLVILDISDKYSPAFINFTKAHASDNNTIEIYNGYAYAAASYSGVKIFDIDPVDQTHLKTTLDNDLNGPTMRVVDIDLQDEYLFVGDYNYGLRIFQADPDSGMEQISTVSAKYLQRIRVRDEYVYITKSSQEHEYIYIVDISNFYYPVMVDVVIADASEEGDFEIIGDYIITATDGLQVIDINPPDDAQLVTSVPGITPIQGITYQDGYIYAASKKTGIQIFDVDPVLTPQLDSVIVALQDVWDMEISDGLVFAATNISLAILGPPGQYTHIWKQVLLPNGPKYMDISNGYAFLVTSEGLCLIDIEPVNEAHLVNTLDVTGTNITCNDGYAYIIGTDLKVIDIDPISSASLVGTLELQGLCIDIDINGQYAFVSSNQGIFQIDLSDPGNPDLIKTIYIVDEAWGIDATDEYVFVASGHHDLQIFDYNDNGLIRYSGGFQVSGLPVSVHYDNGYIYAGSEFPSNVNGSLLVIDVNPIESIHIESNWYPGRVIGTILQEQNNLILGHSFNDFQGNTDYGGISVLKLW